eukprot:CAMPEP_0185274590 /NCGR_PEP_ID=MMETSP1359-20130426/52174_1 /TAXON_ID=552665 /ORGANISM="Bigelowiella longifila, Strain CCMP242" /LENGTH=209 /DNA_ID=CAMNT_0027867629 /DNA_START=177 /DNA_END=806 /DNA_ORIENTATION=-
MSSSSLSPKLQRINPSKFREELKVFTDLLKIVLQMKSHGYHDFLPDAIALAYHLKSESASSGFKFELNSHIAFQLIRFGMVDEMELLKHLEIPDKMSDQARESIANCIDWGYKLRREEEKFGNYKHCPVPIQAKSRYFGVQLYVTDANRYKDGEEVLQRFHGIAGSKSGEPLVAAAVTTGADEAEVVSSESTCNTNPEDGKAERMQTEG